MSKWYLPREANTSYVKSAELVKMIHQKNEVLLLGLRQIY